MAFKDNKVNKAFEAMAARTVQKPIERVATKMSEPITPGNPPNNYQKVGRELDYLMSSPKTKEGKGKAYAEDSDLMSTIMWSRVLNKKDALPTPGEPDYKAMVNTLADVRKNNPKMYKEFVSRKENSDKMTMDALIDIKNKTPKIVRVGEQVTEAKDKALAAMKKRASGLKDVASSLVPGVFKKVDQRTKELNEAIDEN